MTKLWMVGVAIVAAACSKKMSGADASKETASLRDAHRDALKSRCLPAYTALQKPWPRLTEDKVTGVPALHRSNAAAFNERWTAWLDFNTGESKSKREVPGEGVFEFAQSSSSPTFMDMCAWLIQEKSPSASPSPHNDGFGKVSNEQVVATVTSALKDFEAIKFVVAVRIVEFVAPKLDGEEFTAGSLKGEARIFDDKGSDHGGFRFEAASSTKVDYRKEVSRTTGKTTSDDKDSSLDNDLYNNGRSAFATALAKAVPGSDFRAD